MWVIATAILGGVLVLVLRAIHDQAAILRDWEMVLAPWGADVCQELEQRVEAESSMAEYAYRRAFSARSAGSSDEALRLLEVGLRVVERTSPDMITLLRSMGVVSRMAAAIHPVAPLRSLDFRLPSLSAVTGVAGVLHHLLVSTAERFRLRAYLLRRGFGIVVRFLFRSTDRIRESKRNPDQEWDRIARARADLRTLSRESVLTFRSLVLSLTAEPR